MTLKEEFIKLEYTEEDYEIIRNNYAVNQIKDETLIKKLKDNFAFLLKIGYTKEEVITMTKSFPPIYGLSIENIKQKIEDIISLGYTKEEVIKMTKILPSIYGFSIESMKQKIEDIISLGYTKEEVIRMTKSFTPIYGLSIENMKQKIEDMITLGYTKEEVIRMTKSFTSIYGFSIENMKQKIDFYDSIDMHELAVINPKLLMQSVNLSYARYSFYKDRGIDIDMNNYRKLFVEQKKFEKAYGITKKELLEKYDYNKYKEEKEKENGRII